MSIQWVKNMLGSTLTENEMKDIPSPRLELTIDITIKAVQAFGLLGSIVIGTVYSFMAEDSRAWLEIMTAFGRNGMILGMVFGPIMTFLRMLNRGEHEWIDRCYRLRKNQNQKHIAQASILGVTCGVGLVMLGIISSTALGCVMGLLGGVILGNIYNQMS